MAITTEFKITTDSVDAELKKAETSVQKSANKMKSSLDEAGKSNFGENIGQNLQKAGKGFDAVNKMGGKVGGVLKNIQQSFMALLNPIGLVITAVTALTAWGVKMWESLTVNEEQAKATLDFIAKMRGRDTGNAKTDLTDNEKRMQRLKKLSAGGMTFDETQEAHEILQKMGFSWVQHGAKSQIIDLLDEGKVEQAEKLAMGRAKGNLKKSRKKEIQSLIEAVNSNQKVTGTGVANELANMTTYQAEYLLQQMINRRSWDWYASDEERSKALESQIASMTKIVEIMREQQREEQALTLQEKERAEAKKQAEKDALKKAEADYRKSKKESEELKRAREQKEQTEKKIKLDGMTDAQKVKFYGTEISTSQSELADAKKAKRESEAMIRDLKNRLESGELTDQQKKSYYSHLAYEEQQKQLAETKILNIENHILQLQQQKLKLEKKITEEKEKQKADDKKAEEIWESEGFSLKGKSKSKWLAYYMGVRSAVFDEWLKQQMTNVTDAVVIHIGCGMDSRIIRVGNQNHKWYDVDFSEVIEERKRYYAETDDYKMIAGDARDCTWLKAIEEKKSAIVVMEGVSMYLTSGEVR